MTDQQWEECKLLREIARAECEREAELASSLTHTPICQLPPSDLSDEQCVLLYAIYLTLLKQEGSVGVPRENVDPTDHFYLEKDAKQAKRLVRQEQLATEYLSEHTEQGEPRTYWETKRAETEEKLSQLNQAEPMSALGLAMWKHLSANKVETPNKTYQRARATIANTIAEKTESTPGDLKGKQPFRGSAMNNIQPPPAFTASTDWIFSSDLSKKLDVKQLSDVRKGATVDEADEHGRWGVDAVGTFRRKVDGRQVAYFIPSLKPMYATRYSHSEKLTGGVRGEHGKSVFSPMT